MRCGRGASTGRVARRRSHTTALIPAPAQKTAFYPAASLTDPAKVRDRRMPTSRPLLTVPTTWLPCSGGARSAASGTRSCGTQVQMPMRRCSAGQHPERGREGSDAEEERGQRGEAEDQRAPGQYVAERNDQRHPQRVADLREGGHPAGGPRAGVEVRLEIHQQRLRVIEVGGRGPGRDREDGDEASGKSRHGDAR